MKSWKLYIKNMECFESIMIIVSLIAEVATPPTRPILAADNEWPKWQLDRAKEKHPKKSVKQI